MNMAFVLHGSPGGYLLLTICLSTCLSVSGRTVTENQENVSSPEVTIPQGRVRGVNMTTYHGRTVHGFVGLQYAQPPVGDLRFKAPLPPIAWNGTIDAIDDTPACPQMDGNEVYGDEDCLYLNLFTPRLPTSDSSVSLPVIFYLFGGAFKMGSNSIEEYDPYFLLDKDVILVVPNFRVGVLAWLSTGDEVSPGNYGLKDIVRALEWIRDNIKYFGGDPERVTIAGSSSGAMSITMLLMSKSAEGLFHQFIHAGGSGLRPYLQEPNEVAVNRAYTLGAYLGCPTNTSTVLVDCLRGLNASQLVNTTSLFKVSGLVPYTPWHPTIEPEIDGALLTESPVEMFNSGKIRALPNIRSIVHDEGLIATASFYSDEDKVQALVDRIDELLPHLVAYYDAIENVAACTTTLKSYYLNDLTANNSVLLNNLTQLVGDVAVVYPMYKEMDRNMALGKSPQYYMVLEYRGTFSYSYDYSGGSTQNIGVAHSDELIYVFLDRVEGAGPASYTYNEADLKMVETMVELWTSFAISGVPNAMDENGTNIWEPYSSSGNYLRVGNGEEFGLDVKYGWNQQRMDFVAELNAMMEWKTLLHPQPPMPAQSGSLYSADHS